MIDGNTAVALGGLALLTALTSLATAVVVLFAAVFFQRKM